MKININKDNVPPVVMDLQDKVLAGVMGMMMVMIILFQVTFRNNHNNKKSNKKNFYNKKRNSKFNNNKVQLPKAPIPMIITEKMTSQLVNHTE